MVIRWSSLQTRQRNVLSHHILRASTRFVVPPHATQACYVGPLRQSMYRSKLENYSTTANVANAENESETKGSPRKSKVFRNLLLELSPVFFFLYVSTQLEASRTRKARISEFALVMNTDNSYYNDVDFNSFEATHAYWTQLMDAHELSPRWHNGAVSSPIISWFVSRAKELESPEVHSILRDVCIDVHDILVVPTTPLDEYATMFIDYVINQGNAELLKIWTMKQAGTPNVDDPAMNVQDVRWRIKKGREKQWTDAVVEWAQSLYSTIFRSKW